MKRKQRKPLIPDELPLEFFQRITVPENWRFIEKDKFQYAPAQGHWSYGYWYWVKSCLKVRICFHTPAHRGGILEVDMRHRPQKITSILDNKQSYEVNEYIKDNYGKILDTP